MALTSPVAGARDKLEQRRTETMYMGKFHESTYRPTLKEMQAGSWYLLLELYDTTGIPAVDGGVRQIAIVFSQRNRRTSG